MTYLSPKNKGLFKNWLFFSYMVLLVDLTPKFLKNFSHFSPFFQDELFYLQLMHILSIFILLTYWIFFKKQILKNLFTIEHWKTL